MLFRSYLFLQAHYRSKQNFTWEALSAASNALVELKNQIRLLTANGKIIPSYQDQFKTALADDINIPKALAIVWDLLKSQEKPGDKKATILEFDKVFGLSLNKVKKIPTEIVKLANQRLAAKMDKDWQKSDELRQEIEKAGYIIEDDKSGYILKDK